MSCIELRYNKQGKTNIIKLESQSDIQMSDWDILVSFLTTGVLPEGISIYGASASQEQLFDYLWDQLNTIRRESHIESHIETYMLFDHSKAFRTREDVINKVIGNRDIASTMYDRYETDLFSQNALYVAGWGAKKWYGFTSQRPLLITGISELSPNFTDDILFNTYYNIRNGAQHEKNVIEHLYQKLNPNGGDTDIYSKLTWLANNELRTLVDALYVPQYIDKDRAAIRKGLKENFSEYIGALIKYNKEMYFISKKGPEKSVIGINVETGVETEIPISSISSIYEQFTVSFNNKTYYLIDKKWYTKSKKNYKPVDIQLSISLFDKFFGIVENDFESINVYNKENPIYLNSNVPGTSSDVKTFLPIGSYVRTSTGYFTKDEDGEFRNGDEVLSDDSIIYKIFFNKTQNDNSDAIKSLLPIYEEKYYLNKQDAYIILNNIFNIEKEFKNIRFNYDYSGFRVRMTNGIPYMDIGLKKLEQTPENIRQMYLAATLLKELNNDMKLPAIPDLTVNNFWHMLKDYTYESTTANLNGKKIEISDELRNAFEFILNQVPEITGTEWETSIKENIEDLAQNWTMGDNELDTFIDELISKGLFITMCTV